MLGFEALLRLSTKPGGKVAPLEFIRRLETSGEMASVGHWVLRRACLDLVTLQAAAPQPLRLVINVSHVELARAEREHTLIGILWLDIDAFKEINDNHGHLTGDFVLKELARRWKPILDVFEESGVDVAYEIHPGEDLHDGVTFEMFLERVGNHPRANILYDPSHFVLQQLDYLAFIDIYHERIKCFHVKDAEFRPNGRSGVYGGYQSWVDRPGRFRSLGDGQVDFPGIFSKMAANDYAGWAVLEWECALKHPEVGAAEGAPFIDRHIIKVTEHAFDDFAAGGADRALNARLMGIG